MLNRPWLGRERKDDLSGASDKVAAGLLVLDRARETENIDQHYSVSKLGLIIQTVDLTSVLGESSERQNVIQVHTE